MAETASTFDLSKLPPDLVLAVAYDAERDAELVHQFLQALSKMPSRPWLVDNVSKLPGEFFLALGAALRLHLWETRGIRVHLDAGLPQAREAMLDVFRTNKDPEAAERTRNLPARVVSLAIELFAWNGQKELNADITLGEADEEAVLEALADYLWANRPH